MAITVFWIIAKNGPADASDPTPDVFEDFPQDPMGRVLGIAEERSTPIDVDLQRRRHASELHPTVLRHIFGDEAERMLNLSNDHFGDPVENQKNSRLVGGGLGVHF